MKKIISILVFTLGIFLGYKLDLFLFNLIIDATPETEWLELIKIVVGIILFLLTAGTIITLSALITTFVYGILTLKNK